MQTTTDEETSTHKKKKKKKNPKVQASNAMPMNKDDQGSVNNEAGSIDVGSFCISNNLH